LLRSFEGQKPSTEKKKKKKENDVELCLLERRGKRSDARKCLNYEASFAGKGRGRRGRSTTKKRRGGAGILWFQKEGQRRFRK